MAKKVWLVVSKEYGRSSGHVLYVCESIEIANSYVEREYRLDVEGPAYFIKEMEVLNTIPGKVFDF